MAEKSPEEALADARREQIERAVHINNLEVQITNLIQARKECTLEELTGELKESRVSYILTALEELRGAGVIFQTSSGAWKLTIEIPPK